MWSISVGDIVERKKSHHGRANEIGGLSFVDCKMEGSDYIVRKFVRSVHAFWSEIRKIKGKGVHGQEQFVLQRTND